MSHVKPEISHPQHGGNLSWLTRHYPNAPHPLIDLSTGITPYPYPLASQAGWQHRLADSADMQMAFNATARYYRTQPDTIALSSGMQPLMFALASLRFKTHGASQVALLSPSYSEHGHVWQSSGHPVEAITSLDALAQHAVVIITNPNNPDGQTFPPETLLALADQLAAQDGWLIVDESFADLTPALSIAACGKHNVITLHSCGKFFGAAGMRISSAVTTPEWTRWLRMAVGPWPVSTAACHLLPAMLDDGGWIETTRIQLAAEAAAWRVLLAQYVSIIGHTDLFTLTETPHAQTVYEQLAAQGILTRIFDYNPHWIRFGLPDSRHIERIGVSFSGLRA